MAVLFRSRDLSPMDLVHLLRGSRTHTAKEWLRLFAAFLQVASVARFRLPGRFGLSISPFKVGSGDVMQGVRDVALRALTDSRVYRR